MTDPTMAPIERAGIQHIELTHKGRQIGPGGHHHKMEMGVHQHIPMHRDRLGVHRTPQAGQERVTIVVIVDDGLTGIAPAGHMITGSQIGQPQGAGHAGSAGGLKLQSQEYRADP